VCGACFSGFTTPRKSSPKVDRKRTAKDLPAAGFEQIEMNVVQPAAIAGEAKLVSPLTMENLADAVLAEGLTDRDEIDSVVASLYELARDDRTVMSFPRVIQAWGRAPR
jgi:hypothetical protein